MTQDQKRQLYLLVGLVVALGVILYFQVGKLRRLKEEEVKYSPEAVLDEMRKAKLPLRIGDGPEGVVEVTGMEIHDRRLPVVSVHEVEEPQKKHLAWVDTTHPSSHLVSLDFLPPEILNATAPAYTPLSWQSGALEWEDGERTIRGVPDGYGDYFDITDASVEMVTIHRYHPVRDAVPALNHPRSVTVEAALAEEVMGTTWEAYLSEGDSVLGLSVEGEAKAYPIRVMNFHEIVNDTCGGASVTVVYSPLTGSGMAYRARVGDGTTTFGHSGFLLECAPLIYDRKTRSLWNHFDGEAVTGPSQGTHLEVLPLVHTTWKTWRERYPGTLVLSGQTSFPFRYGMDPYRHDFRTNYYAMERLIAPITLPQGGHDVAIAPIDDRLSNKEWVLGLRGKVTRHAYPISELARQEENPMVVQIDGAEVKIVFDPESETGFALDMEDRPLAEATLALWFAWYSNYPDTELFLVDTGSS
jgi:hypothetical protein